MSSSRISQESVLDFLASPASSGGAPVTRIDTHAASVFLSGLRALKVKRAVKFPFLDYSTLDLRKRACLAEIEVNRPFAPEIYIGIARITREQDGSLRVGGEGEVVEWAVEMRRFDEGLTLDRYVEGNEIPPAMANAVVRKLAEVHRGAPRVEPSRWIAALEGFLRQHHQVFADHPALFDRAQADALLQTSQDFLAREASLIAARAEAGLLVRGHGDLHLGNIVLVKGAPVIFDAVEFDPLIAAGDVFYDLGFFIMDLVVHGQFAAANAALNGYLACSGRSENLDGLRLLPLFLSVRSAIRAVVAAARVDRSNKPADAAAAKRYFEHARRFLAPRRPVLIAVGGLSGTGKSHLARLLAPDVLPEPGAVILRSDVKRKAMHGVPETTRLGASAYRKEVTEKVYGSIMADAGRVLAAGHSVILDAVFARPGEREAARQAAERAGVAFHGIFLQTALETRVGRIEQRSGDASDADRSVALAQESQLVEPADWTPVDSSGEPEATLKAARSAIGLPGRDSAP